MSKTRAGSDPESAPATPRWIKVFAVVVIILVVLFVLLHLSGNGFGNHMPMSSMAPLAQGL